MCSFNNSCSKPATSLSIRTPPCLMPAQADVDIYYINIYIYIEDDWITPGIAPQLRHLEGLAGVTNTLIRSLDPSCPNLHATSS